MSCVQVIYCFFSDVVKSHVQNRRLHFVDISIEETVKSMHNRPDLFVEINITLCE